MPLDAPDRLPQTGSPPMQMVRMTALMLMEDHAGFRMRILRAMQIPVMPGIPALDRDIPVIRHDDTEIFPIQFP